MAELYWHAALPLVVQARGGEVLHASGVLMPRGVVVLCGASKSGKSTIAYGLHRRGHRLWADDAVALEVTESAITAWPLPFDVRLRPATAALFGLGERAARLAGADDSSGDGRAPAPLEAVCVLGRRRGADGRRCLRHSASVAYPALLANAYCFSLEDPPRKRLMLERYLSLVARVPVMALRPRTGSMTCRRSSTRSSAPSASPVRTTPVTDADRLLRILVRGGVTADLEDRARGVSGNVSWSRCSIEPRRMVSRHSSPEASRRWVGPTCRRR